LRNRYCDTVVGIYEREAANEKRHRACTQSHQAALEYIGTLRPDGMVFAMRWTFKLYPVQGEIEQLDFDNREGGAGAENERSYYAYRDGKASTNGALKITAVRDFVHSLLDLELPLFLVYPIPEVGWPIAEYNFKHLIAGEKIPPTVSIDYNLFVARNSFVTQHLDALDAQNLVRIKPERMLCNTYIPGRCVAQMDSKPLYNDDDHLSDLGAALIVDEIMRSFRARTPH
jgi:hypothetical protein